MRPLPLTEDRVSRARAMLADQQTRLLFVIEQDEFPSTTNLARHYLAKVESWQRESDAFVDLALGAMGPNGFGRAIDDVCKDAALHARANRMLDAERRVVSVAA